MQNALPGREGRFSFQAARQRTCRTTAVQGKAHLRVLCIFFVYPLFSLPIFSPIELHYVVLRPSPSRAMCDENALKESEAYAVALGLLARREHSAKELRGKLNTRGYGAELVETVLSRLAAERLQSDERFAEVYLRQRSGKGHGPERIRAELRERGIDDQLISARFRQAEDEGQVDWFELAAITYAKKYGRQPIGDLKERAKRQRFLQYRGFTYEQIAAAIKQD